MLVGAELDRPYQRPPLSKQLLRGEVSAEDAFVHAASFYDDHDIELRLGERVHDIEPDPRLVHLHDGDPIGYDRLLLATGARPRRLRVPGAELDRIHYLRDLGDNETLRKALPLCAPVRRAPGGVSDPGLSNRQERR